MYSLSMYGLGTFGLETWAEYATFYPTLLVNKRLLQTIMADKKGWPKPPFSAKPN